MPGQEIDLLKNYPKAKRDLSKRLDSKTSQHRAIAQKFGKEFFDGSRDTGYGGFTYNPKYWTPVIPDMREHFGLTSDSSLLDVGCAKGFFLFDLSREIEGITLAGVDISEYAIDNAHSAVKDVLSVQSCDELNFEDDSFDIVTSITTIHNLEYSGCIKALKEIQRVAKLGSFITVDAYRNDEERARMEAWNLTAKTILHVDDWRELFDKAGYTGDYYWFMP